jgi:hypothetical protein
MTTHKKLNQTLRPRFIINNPCALRVKSNKLNNLKMKADKKQQTILTTKNGATVTVAKDEQGRLIVLDSDSQFTRQVLPDGLYSSDGIKDFPVKDGKFFKSKFSLKAGIRPIPSKLPMTTIAQKMANQTEARKQEISTKRFNNEL